MSDLVVWGLVLLGVWMFRRHLMAVVWRLVPIAVLLLAVYLVLSGQGQQLLDRLG